MKPKSIARRAFLALVLMIGFYALAIGISATLLYIPYAEWTYAGRLHMKLAFICVGTSFAILFSIIPRRDKFIKPGPSLNPTEHTKLFKELNDISRLSGQKMPSEVYLVSEVNAWVSERGGFMGFGSRRIMGIGLPLLKILTVDELKGVIAHEFGHYFGGDTKLAPWVYKTRLAIERTLQNLSEKGSFLQKPFVAYGNMFLRITHSISRVQEYNADKIAANIVGVDSFKSGLTTISGLIEAYEHYWRQEIVPILNSGYKPEITEGFNHYINTPIITKYLADTLDYKLKNSETNVYATHPVLKDRLTALDEIACTNKMDGSSEKAITLINNIEELELDILRSIAGDEAVSKLVNIPWESVASKVFLPYWEASVSKCKISLKGFTFDQLSKLVEIYKHELNDKINDKTNEAFNDKEKIQIIGNDLGATITVALHRTGWNISTMPGEAVIASNGTNILEPFTVVNKLVSKSITEGEWLEICINLGIANLEIA